MKKKQPFVSIIIVNHNGKDLMKECLDSLLRIDYPKNRLEIIVVDNCSEDGSLEFMKRKYKNIKNIEIIENKLNNYCQACNLGIVRARGDYIVLLNNDVRVKQRWLLELVKVMEEDGSIGAATSKLLKDNKTIQNAGLYELPNFYWNERGAGKESRDYDFISEVDAISGACVLYRRTALNQIGSLDEDFVMFGEDVDMSIRLKKRGWKLVYVPCSVAYHKLHGSCNESFAHEAIEKNRLLLIAKHFPTKLSNALLGSGYFTVNGKNKKSGQFFDLIPHIFLKLIKEHSFDVAYAVMKEVSVELKRILNYDTEKLEYDLKNIFNDLIETRKHLP